MASSSNHVQSQHHNKGTPPISGLSQPNRGSGQGESIKSGIVGTSLNGPMVTLPNGSHGNYHSKNAGSTSNNQQYPNYHQIYGQHQKGSQGPPIGMVSSNKFATQDHGHSRKTHSNKNRTVHQPQGSNPLTNTTLQANIHGRDQQPGAGRGYNSVNKGQNGRKGQQALQSSYFNRGQINANQFMSGSHDGSLRGMQPQPTSGNNSTHGHPNLIKSYDAAALSQQRATNNVSAVNNNTGGMGNFATVVQNSSQQQQRDGSNNHGHGGGTRETSLNRRGGHSNGNSHIQGQIQHRQKNNSHNSMHPGGMQTLQHRENFISAQTPQANLQGYNSHAPTIDHDANVHSNMRGGNVLTNPHRRGNSNNIEHGRSPQKHSTGVSLKYANQQYGKSGDLAHQRANARSQLSGAPGNSKTNSLVTQSLDPVKLTMAKRKASNDDSRFKSRFNGLNGGHLPNTQNLMAPFLDTSLDATNQRDAARPPPSKQPQSKEKSRQEANTNLGGDQSRPRTSTGIRGGNGMFHPKIGQQAEDPSSHIIPPPQQQSLPTKSGYASYQTNKLANQGNSVLNKGQDKNDNLRGSLRRSYDANSGSLPNSHPHGIQPVNNSQQFQKLPNRPHSSNKMTNNHMPQRHSTNNNPQQPSSTNNERGVKEKGNRKRDFSKVVDVVNRSINGSSNQADNSRTIEVQSYLNRHDLSNQAPGSNQPQQPNQFNTIQPPNNNNGLHDNSKQKHAGNKVQQKKQHLRSLTSHKLTAPTKSLQIRKEDMQRESSLNRPGQSTSLSHNQNLAEIAEVAGKVQNQEKARMPSEDRQSRANIHKEQSNVGKRAESRDSNAIRASITREVTTSKPLPAPAQTQPGVKKFDNCVTKFSFATKTGYSPKNPNKVNQDSYLVLPHLGEYRRTHFFSVCDGHGVFGKEVSEFIKTRLGQYVEQSIKTTFDQAKLAQRVVDSTEVKEQLNKSFNLVQETLYRDSKINLRFSGSTCVSVLIVGTKVFCANVGDSRAVLVRQNRQNDQLLAIPLNRDHKADEPDEEARILRNGGRVQPYRDIHGNPLGPLRVWHLKEDIPGLAMTRSFGDQAAAQVGVIASPEILEMNLMEGDQFIILASDGVWEFISNEEAANIIMPHYLNNSAEKAAEAIIKESIKRWQEEDSSIDDITCIIIFLSI